MTQHTRGPRRYRKSVDRRVQVFSESGRDSRTERIARIITSAGLEQARLEAAARAEHVERDEGGEHA